jgi:quercetin dioxygenase-like cupin family protein
MKSFKLQDMTKGWFVGQFEPRAEHSEACEVAVKKYRKGETEAEHYHKLSTEVTVVVSGRVRMCGQVWEEGAIIVLPPNTPTDFEALEDTVSTVVKLPASVNDKYLGRPDEGSRQADSVSAASL